MTPFAVPEGLESGLGSLPCPRDECRLSLRRVVCLDSLPQILPPQQRQKFLEVALQVACGMWRGLVSTVKVEGPFYDHLYQI